MSPAPAPLEGSFTLTRLLMRPVARFCVRHAIKIQDCIECFKWELLLAARETLRDQGAKDTPSRLSVLTGLRRREIARLSEDHLPSAEPLSLIAKVLGRWQQDPQFCTKSGSARCLRIGAELNEFSQLVCLVSKELSPAAVLFELERLGIVERSPHGLRLRGENYVPTDDALRAFAAASGTVHDFLSAVDQNLFGEQRPPHHQLTTEFDNIRPEAKSTIQHWLLREGQALHRKLRKYLAAHDGDLSPQPESAAPPLRVMFGSFSFFEPRKPR